MMITVWPQFFWIFSFLLFFWDLKFFKNTKANKTKQKKNQKQKQNADNKNNNKKQSEKKFGRNGHNFRFLCLTLLPLFALKRVEVSGQIIFHWDTKM